MAVKISALTTKVASGSTASQIFFPLVEMDGSPPETFKMGADELRTLQNANGYPATIPMGGISGVHPMLKRSSTDIEVKTADDAFYTSVGVSGVILHGTSGSISITPHTDSSYVNVPACRIGGEMTFNSAYGITGPKAITLTGGSAGSSAPLLTGSQTWASTGTYHLDTSDVTDSGPSNASSTLIRRQVGGATKFAVRKDGAVISGNSVLSGATDGKFLLTDAAGTSFTALQMGGTTTSYPSLKRSSTAVHVRLADDSAYAPLVAGSVGVNGVYTLPTVDGTSGQVLSTNGAGTVTWASSSVADGSVTYAKIQNVSATDKILGRSSAGAGVVQEITCTAAARALLDDASAADMRATLGFSEATSGAFGLDWLTTVDLASARTKLAPTGTPSATTYLRGDGQWATPAGGGGSVTDGDYGEITVTGGVWTLDNNIAIDCTSLTSTGTITTATTFAASAKSQLISNSDGVWLATNAASNGFTKFQLGGPTSSFPSIDRNGAGIDFKLADGSAAANVSAAVVTAESHATTAANVVTDTTTGITLTTAHNGKVLLLSNASQITVTANTGLGKGFSCTVIQGNTGPIIFAGSASRVFQYSSQTATARQYDVATIRAVDVDVLNIAIDSAGKQEEVVIACSDETTALTTGTAKRTVRMPFAMTLSDVRASVTTAPTGSGITVDINEGGSTLMTTTKLTIAAGATTSVGGTPAVLTDTSLADNAQITIDIDAVGSTVAGAGLKVTLIGRRT